MSLKKALLMLIIAGASLGFFFGAICLMIINRNIIEFVSLLGIAVGLGLILVGLKPEELKPRPLIPVKKEEDEFE